ncbi:hypothetical protein CANTEDRAFT_116013 [Yamadazyma tenuis ATCC 10573]|uniref:Uncharacterized protein n=1 Tax=Candida tenuis (strain ATCC 10573 / BCRC 21748 / CBS 615 / JCM 9827 / NBRC 10315 / NRRL Y-1498 / VKM Y-70) TaxID=590646 RepID=G3BF15_CANTC|nr:uncharacterized protein CANTEDRAFT_116013 [Yamadazyma tenuis ATCC 10573]EGV59986.1 hypothetical protein CANTEDRAFT_116013 [Yamadazyma tenuis ATCC 10573]
MPTKKSDKDAYSNGFKFQRSLKWYPCLSFQRNHSKIVIYLREYHLQFKTYKNPKS